MVLIEADVCWNICNRCFRKEHIKALQHATSWCFENTRLELDKCTSKKINSLVIAKKHVVFVLCVPWHWKQTIRASAVWGWCWCNWHCLPIQFDPLKCVPTRSAWHFVFLEWTVWPFANVEGKTSLWGSYSQAGLGQSKQSGKTNEVDKICLRSWRLYSIDTT